MGALDNTWEFIKEGANQITSPRFYAPSTWINKFAESKAGQAIDASMREGQAQILPPSALPEMNRQRAQKNPDYRGIIPNMFAGPPRPKYTINNGKIVPTALAYEESGTDWNALARNMGHGTKYAGVDYVPMPAETPTPKVDNSGYGVNIPAIQSPIRDAYEARTIEKPETLPELMDNRRMRNLSPEAWFIANAMMGKVAKEGWNRYLSDVKQENKRTDRELDRDKAALAYQDLDLRRALGIGDLDLRAARQSYEKPYMEGLGRKALAEAKAAEDPQEAFKQKQILEYQDELAKLDPVTDKTRMMVIFAELNKLDPSGQWAATNTVEEAKYNEPWPWQERKLITPAIRMPERFAQLLYGE